MVQPLVKTKITKKFGRKFKRYQSDRKIAVKVRATLPFFWALFLGIPLSEV